MKFKIRFKFDTRTDCISLVYIDIDGKRISNSLESILSEKKEWVLQIQALIWKLSQTEPGQSAYSSSYVYNDISLV